MNARRISVLRTAGIFLVAATLAGLARAGVTIHYEGTATSGESVAKILAAVTAYAKEHKWKVDDGSALNGKLERQDGDKTKDYHGKVTGVIVQVNDDCEPLAFQFDTNLFLQDEVKTQFAGAAVHIQIVELLETLKPFFKELTVEDEGGYWDDHDKAALESRIDGIGIQIDEQKRKHPEIQTAYRMRNGRIADVAK
ncbi:MAG: hypothetical protein JWM35_2164 [Verrucomicrobia bacterium]|nr:hypothetical protein [Verrucomicrobiota bacterium]